MQQAYIVTGMMTDERTLTLDEALPVKGARVRVVIEALAAPAQAGHTEFMAALRERQRQRGHVPRTREQVDAYLRAERENWDD